jgi:hypothetical protein
MSAPEDTPASISQARRRRSEKIRQPSAESTSGTSTEGASNEKYDEAVRKGREAAKSQWVLGDLALELEPKYGNATLQHFADDIGVEYQTLKVYRYVAGQYEKGTRIPGLSFSVCQIFAGQGDRAELLSERKWTAKEAREYVQGRNGDQVRGEELTELTLSIQGQIADELDLIGKIQDARLREATRQIAIRRHEEAIKNLRNQEND